MRKTKEVSINNLVFGNVFLPFAKNRKAHRNINSINKGDKILSLVSGG